MCSLLSLNKGWFCSLVEMAVPAFSWDHIADRDKLGFSSTYMVPGGKKDHSWKEDNAVAAVGVSQSLSPEGCISLSFYR
jgi:hypothetical protein